MTNKYYYIEKDNKIVLFDSDFGRLKETIEDSPQYKGLEIKETPDGYTIYEFELMTEEQAEQKAIQKEKEKINNLTMTALDFKNVLNSFGLGDEQILAFLNSNPSLLLQITLCQNVYCGVAKSFMPISVDGITITAEMVEAAFVAKGVN